MKRRNTAQEKKLADNERLLRWWKKFHREEREAVLAGPHSVVLGELFRMFKNLQHVRPAQLLGFARSNSSRPRTPCSAARWITVVRRPH